MGYGGERVGGGLGCWAHCVDGWMDGWMDGWKDVCMYVDGWMDGSLSVLSMWVCMGLVLGLGVLMVCMYVGRFVCMESVL